MRLLALIIAFACFNSCALAQWYETQGHAYVVQGDKDEAKNRAMENALKKALLVAGASVSSVQQVVNGLLTQDEINIRATGNVNSFELVNETYQDNTVTVTIRADIFPQSRQCFSADYKKSILLTKSHIVEREQANIGSIYNLEQSVIKKLAQKINQQGLYLAPKLSVKSSNEFSRYHKSLQAEKIKSISMSLGQMTDSQYILFSEIEDLSMSGDANNNWQFWQEDIFERFFHFSVYLFNGNNGEMIFEKRYQQSAPWNFSKREQPNVNSNAFWQSSYGHIIENTLNEVITDIDDNMMCQPTRGKIVKVNGNQVTFNLGKQHGVKIGDQFSLLHMKNFTSNTGIQYAGYNVSPFKVTVNQVSQSSANAITSDHQPIDSIQIDDLIVRY